MLSWTQESSFLCKVSPKENNRSIKSYFQSSCNCNFWHFCAQPLLLNLIQPSEYSTGDCSIGRHTFTGVTFLRHDYILFFTADVDLNVSNTAAFALLVELLIKFRTFREHFCTIHRFSMSSPVHVFVCLIEPIKAIHVIGLLLPKLCELEQELQPRIATWWLRKSTSKRLSLPVSQFV